MLHAAFLNGISSHAFDVDDAHLKAIIHPAGPVASSILSLAETHPLLALPNVLATAHIGFVERDIYERYLGDAFDAINAFAAGLPIHVVA